MACGAVSEEAKMVYVEANEEATVAGIHTRGILAVGGYNGFPAVAGDGAVGAMAAAGIVGLTAASNVEVAVIPGQPITFLGGKELMWHPLSSIAGVICVPKRSILRLFPPNI